MHRVITATRNDVVAGYRLILGREPDEAGARTFFSLISNGQFPVVKLGELFMNSPEAVQLRAQLATAANRLELVELDGFRMTVAPEWNLINKGIALCRDYEPHITGHLRELLTPGKVFIDIGANIGYYSLLAAAKGAIVYAFEPNARNLWLLRKNAHDNDLEIAIFPYALADSERLVIYTPLRGNGQISDLLDSLPSEEQEVLRSATLDQALNGIRPDIVKIDVEGAEGLVLQGAQKTLDFRPIVISEFSATNLPVVSRVSAGEYLDEFVRRDYSLYLCRADGVLVELGAGELESASLESDTNLVDFIAKPRA
jgi:FkbM family methyltransferase